MALEKENDRTTQFNTFSLLSNEVKNSSRCWVWLPRGFLIIKLDTAVWTARPCRNSTSFSLRVQGETGIFKAFARNLMESFYRQRCLLTPRAPSKIVWLAWLLKSRAGDQQNISACKWHLGQNARAQCHERETGKPCDILWQSYFPKMLPSSAKSAAGKQLPGGLHLSRVIQRISRLLKWILRCLPSVQGSRGNQTTALPAHVPKKC